MNDDRNPSKGAVQRSDSPLAERENRYLREALARGKRELERNRLADESFATGITALYEKRYGDALKAFERALKVHPDFAQAYYYLGLTYFMLGRYNGSVEAYRNAIEKGYTHPMVVQSLADALFVLERYDEAVEAYQTVIQMRPSPQAFARMGQAFSLLGKREEAIAAFKEALLRKLVDASAGDLEPIEEAKESQ